MQTRLIIAIGALMLAAPLGARAQLTFTFTPATQVGSPGTPLTFSGTFTNSGSSELFLNGYNTSPLSSNLTLDDTKFFNNVPLSLLGGQSFSGELFDINVSPTVMPGDYVTAFTVIGGLDGSVQNDLATQSFTVRVPAPAVPEASTGTAVGSGLIGIGLLVLRRRARRV